MNGSICKFLKYDLNHGILKEKGEVGEVMKICICDDEFHILDEIEKILRGIASHSSISKFASTCELRKAIQKEVIDILFIDIKLGDTNGIDFVKKNDLYLKNTKIIYITGYTEYIEDVFETTPVYFLQKPLNEERIKKAYQKAYSQIREENLFITIKSGAEKIKIKIKDIYYIESCARTITIYLEDKTYTTYEKLSMFESVLTPNFLRIHKSFLVNMDKIIKYKNNTIVLENNKVLNISRSYYKSCRETILEYLEEA